MRHVHLLALSLVLVGACAGADGTDGAQGPQGPPGEKGAPGAASSATVDEIAEMILSNPELVDAIVAKIAEDEALVERLRGEQGPVGVCDCGGGENNGGGGAAMDCGQFCEVDEDCPSASLWTCLDGACKYTGCTSDADCSQGAGCR